MVDVSFEVTGRPGDDVKGIAENARKLLEVKYLNDAKRNDSLFLDRLEEYRKEIIDALALPPWIMVDLKAKLAKEFGCKRK